MRGSEGKQIDAFSYVSIEDRIPARHPIRPFKTMVNEILRAMDAEFDTLYADGGRPSIAPEYLLRASILQILYSIVSRLALHDVHRGLQFGPHAKYRSVGMRRSAGPFTMRGLIPFGRILGASRQYASTVFRSQIAKYTGWRISSRI
jgi:hypothetical protein